MANIDKHKIFHVLEVICQQILAVFVLLVFWEVWNNYSLSSLHAWHVLLSVSGVALYVAEGVILFNRESIFLVDSHRTDRVIPHGVIMGLGFLNLLIGIALKIKDKEDASRTHFNTTHGILGLITLILMFVVVLGGLLAASRFGAGQKYLIKTVHLLLGVTTYLLGIITLGFGLSYLVLLDKGRNALIVLMSIYVVYSLKGPITTLLNRAK